METFLAVCGAITLVALGFIIANVLKPYFSGYSKKKGENLATHEDIEKLVDQVKAVTEATQAIETRISTEVWNRQRQWEMKRDILVEAARELSAIDDALMLLNNTYIAEKQSIDKGEPDVGQWTARKAEALEIWGPASRKFDTARFWLHWCAEKL